MEPLLWPCIPGTVSKIKKNGGKQNAHLVIYNLSMLIVMWQCRAT